MAIREDPKKGTFVENLTKVKVNSAKETYEAFLRGSMRRRVGETEMNRNSSRSHSVFSVANFDDQRANDQREETDVTFSRFSRFRETKIDRGKRREVERGIGD